MIITDSWTQDKGQMGVFRRKLNKKRGMNVHTPPGFRSRKLQSYHQQEKSDVSPQGIVTEKCSKSWVIRNTQLMEVSEQQSVSSRGVIRNVSRDMM